MDPDRLFAYGSLMFDEVLRVLIGRAPDRTPATVEGWRAAALPGRVYPVLVPAATRASGLVLSGITPAEWRILDAYEDDLYDLVRLPLVDGGHAWTYVAPPKTDALDKDWSATEFGKQLDDYVTDCRKWRAEYGEPLTP